MPPEGLKNHVNEQEKNIENILIPIITKKLAENGIELWKRTKINDLIRKNTSLFSGLKKGDKISIEAQDNNGYELKINEKLYVINIANSTIIEMHKKPKSNNNKTQTKTEKSDIEKKLNSLNKTVSIDKNAQIIEKNGEYKINLYGITLDIPFENASKAENMIQFTYELLNRYKKTESEKGVYAKEMDITKGNDESAMVIAIKDSGKIWDTDFLYEENFTKITGINPSRENKIFETYASFLNQLIEKNKNNDLGNTQKKLEKTSSIELTQSGAYKIHVKGKTLNLQIKTQEKAEEALEMTLKILKLYQSQKKQKGNEFYAEKSIKGIGRKDLFLDNNLLNDTIYLKEETFINIFGTQDIETYAHFLNQIVNNKE